MRPICLPIICVGLLAACNPSEPDSGPSDGTERRTQAAARAGRDVPNEYVVVLWDSVADSRQAGSLMATQHRGQLRKSYGSAIKAFSIRVGAEEVGKIAQNPRVRFIEPNRYFTLHGVQSPTPSWGLDRIDQNDLPLNSTFSYPYTGSGVHLYILDSGLNASHTDVQGRVGNGYSAVGGERRIASATVRMSQPSQLERSTESRRRPPCTRCGSSPAAMRQRPRTFLTELTGSRTTASCPLSRT